MDSQASRHRSRAPRLLLTSLILSLAGISVASASGGPGEAAATRYRVPAPAQDRVTSLVDGAQELPGRLTLTDVSIGDEVRVRFEGGGGHLEVQILHPSQAGPGVTWKGRQLAVQVKSTDLDRRFRQDAVAQLVARLSAHDKGWVWEREEPSPSRPGAVETRAADPLGVLERAVTSGEMERARTLAQSLLDGGTLSGSGWRRGAVAMWRQGDEALARAFAQGGLKILIEALDLRRGTGANATPDADRIRLAMAELRGLDADLDAAIGVASGVVEAGRLGCQVSRVLETLLTAGLKRSALVMASELASAGLRCDRAWAAWADAARLTDGPEAAAPRLAEGLETWPSSTRLRAARARWILAVGEDGPVALDDAALAVRGGPPSVPEVATLMRCALAQPVPLDVTQAWEAALAQAPEDPRALVMAGLACHLTGRHGCAHGHLRSALGRVPDHPDLPGIVAWMALDVADVALAERALERAWEDAPRSAATLAAARESATRGGDGALIARLNDAYRRSEGWGVGPVPRVPLASREGFPWFWAACGALAAAVAVLLRRRRKGATS